MDLGSLDLGELYYHRQAGARPVVVVQNDVGCIHSETITVVSLTSQLKRPELPAHYILDAAITSHLGYEIAWCVEAP